MRYHVGQDSLPLEEFLMTAAAKQAITAGAIDAKARRRGLELSESDLAQIAEEQAENRALLEDLISRLDLSADPPGLFDSLTSEYNEDTTLPAYPDGRLFGPGRMGEEFERACAALDEGRYGGVVETEAGLYLILRLPIRPDMAADSSGSTLRYRTAYDRLFQKQIDEWCTGLDVDYEETYGLIERGPRAVRPDGRRHVSHGAVRGIP